MRPLKYLALAALVLALAACSLTKVAYNNAGFMVTYLVDDYLDLNSPQEDWVRERLGKAIAWHRQQELPEYERFLRDTLARTERTFTATDARFVSDGLRKYFKRTMEKILPDIADLLAQLDAEQVAHFEKRYTDESVKIARETVKPAPPERTEKRAKKMIEQIETYTGRLSSDQRDLVTGRVHFIPDVAEMRLADRRTRQELLVKLVRARPAKPEMVASLDRLLVEPDSWRDPQYTVKMKEREDQIIEMVVVLAATLTPEQRGNVQKKLRSYLNDVTSLMALR
ncbi:DUF6279 family lipoprotein [Usitatibacter palustris]|uniref:Lipoprotein n=1 Tax=Usitatibacter palustris TaxID=2732487 RepID=A0A6M4H869_9PROT|nr:DUF6279 family lipoprotein [Usitatibacter palustris]QJR15780.1 hypothetical protein DSM104440_02606 [Usitatibacter palustris]